MLHQSENTNKKRVVLLGGGHAHVKLLYLMRHKGGYEDSEVILISKNSWQYYSGMIGGFLEGIYKEEELRFNLIELCERSKVIFIEEEVVKIHPEERLLIFSNGETLNFDILSIDIGSEINGLELAGVREYASQIKPFDEIIRFRRELLDQKYFADPIIFAGGGPAGIELALSLKQLLIKYNLPFNIAVVNAGSPIRKGPPGKMARKIDSRLKKEGIHSISGDRIQRVGKSKAYLKDGIALAFSFLLWTTGPKASPIMESSGFETDENGYMLVNKYLQAVNYPSIFGAGDCISFGKSIKIKKAGVYAVREADYLYYNIKATLNNHERKAYRPQKHYLSIISIGRHRGLLNFRGLVMEGQFCWRLKDFIDCRFMKLMKS